MADYTLRLIERLNGSEKSPAAPMEPEEPPFEIEEVRDEPGGYDFEIGLSDEIAHVYSFKVDWLVRRLSRQAGRRHNSKNAVDIMSSASCRCPDSRYACRKTRSRCRSNSNPNASPSPLRLLPHSAPSSASTFPMPCIVREPPKGFTKREIL